MTSTTLSPVSGNERLDNLDVLRGLALLGIALMNVEYFTAPLVDMSSGIDAGQGGVHWLADAFVHVFVSGKFWTLFSMLFGMGFAVMLQRAQAAGRPFVPVYLRRTAGLLAFGLMHAWLIWAGDILVSYALGAIVLLLLFRNTPVSRLWKWGAGIWAVLLGMMLLGVALMGLAATMDPEAAGPAQLAGGEAMRAAEIAAYTGGSYAEAVAVRMRFFTMMLGNNLFLVPLVVGMFLVGAWLVRSGAMAAVDAHRALFVRMAWIAGLGGALLTALSLMVEVDPAPGTDATAADMLALSLHMLGSPLMSLAYLSIVVLALQRGVRWLRLVAPAGRMALTNYLLQSVVGTLVFYGYGLGMWGEVARGWQVLGVVLFFIVQVLLSRWWLARFSQGPLEWLWRGFTYLRFERPGRTAAA